MPTHCPHTLFSHQNASQFISGVRMSVCGTKLVDNVLVSSRTLELREEWKGLSFTELLFLMAREHVQNRGKS